MDTASHKTVQRLLAPLAAAFVALVCLTILGLSFYREWSEREAALRAAETNLGNLTRSLIRQVEDSIELLDTGVVGNVSRLEIDGTGPAALSRLEALMIARKAAVDRIYHIAVLDDRGELLAATGSMERSFSDQEFFRYHRTWPSHEAFVGSPIQRKGSGDWIVTVSRRFDRPDGSFGGVVFAGVDATSISVGMASLN
jgi:hypothetical protein